MDLLKAVGRKKEQEIEPNPELFKQLQARIGEIFKIYDFYGMNNIQCEFTGHVFRMLGCVPMDKDITEFISLAENPTEKGKIRFADFVKNFFAWLLEERMKPSDCNELLNALKSINPGGGITAERFSYLISEYGEAMSDDQVKAMLAVAIDRRTEKCHYDVFAFKLFHNQNDSLYVLAKEIMKPMEPSTPNEPVAKTAKS